jgi:hypothetical protein
MRPENSPESEASGIAAKGTSCEAARDVATFATGHIGKPYDTPSGCSCQVQQREEDPTLLVDYLCRRAEAQVSFTVS